MTHDHRISSTTLWASTTELSNTRDDLIAQLPQPHLHVTPIKNKKQHNYDDGMNQFLDLIIPKQNLE